MVIRLSGISRLHYNWLLISRCLLLMFIPVDTVKSLYSPLRPLVLSIYTGNICERFSNNNGKRSNEAQVNLRQL